MYRQLNNNSIVLFIILIVYFAVHCSSFSRGKSNLNVRVCVDYRLSPWRLLSSAIELFSDGSLMYAYYQKFTETAETIQLCLFLVQFCELFLYVQSFCTLYERVLRESFRLVFNISFLPNSRELSFFTSLRLYSLTS
jgi:hypothetical protein